MSVLEDLVTARSRGVRPVAPAANLWDADLRDADLWRANLRGANLWDADLWRADLRGANLWDAGGGILSVNGLPSGGLILHPTCDGWKLRVGCWSGTPDGLCELISQDEGWPEAEGDEVTRRRPLLQAALQMVHAHMAANGNALASVAHWGESS